VVLNILRNSESEQSGGGCGDGEPCGSGLEKIYPTTAVRYGQMRHIGEFTRPAEMRFGCSAKVVVQTRRGIEIGDQVSLTCNGCEASVDRQQMMDYAANSGPEYYELKSGRILRLATEEDLADFARISSDCQAKERFCQELAQRNRLDIRVVSCEHLFGGERIIFYFTAEGRVDFRALVKDLAREYQTRIEMRQIGARDEARLVADYETCGRECCCKNFLKSLKPVSMKMAKLQKATLDPSKVSGRCGRLKCCLRYEHTSYEQLDRSLPRLGTKVEIREGRGTVVARQILTQLLQVVTEDGGRITVVVEDLLDPEEAAQARAARAPAPVIKPAPARPVQPRPPASQGAPPGDRNKRRRRKRPPDTAGAVPSAPPQNGASSGQETPPDPAAQPGGNANEATGPGRRRRKRRPARNRRGSGRGGSDQRTAPENQSGPPAKSNDDRSDQSGSGRDPSAPDGAGDDSR